MADRTYGSADLTYGDAEYSYNGAWSAAQALAESVTTTDTSTKDATRILQETTSVTDTYNRMWMVNRIYLDSITLLGTINKGYTNPLTEIVTLSDLAQEWLKHRELGFAWQNETHSGQLWLEGEKHLV